MSGVPRGLALIFAEANHARLHAGLTLACGAAALDRPVMLFFHGESVAALAPGRHWQGDVPLVAAGIPSLANLFASAADLGVEIMACQSGLHLCGLSPAALHDGVEAGGMIAFLAAARDAELLLA